MSELKQVVSLVFVDGVYSEKSSNTQLLPQEVTLQLNRNSFCLDVSKNYTVPVPIRLLFLNKKSHSNTAAHNKIIVHENSELIITEEYISDAADNYFTAVTTEINTEDHARVQYYKIQNEHITATHTATIAIKQKKESCVKVFSLSQGAQKASDTLQVKLNEQGAQCYLHGLYAINQDKQCVEQHIQVEHIASHTTSGMLYKGILDKKTRAVFNGKVFVHKNAKQVSAHQANHNLLLSAHAEVDTKPELEIYTDDVKCTHGTTVGQLDAELLFYLRSRGINQTDAIKMLTHAFADEVLARIPNQLLLQHYRESTHVA